MSIFLKFTNYFSVMEIDLKADLTLRENLDLLYNKRKKLKVKLERLKEIIKKTEDELRSAKKHEHEKEEEKKEMIKRASRDKKWFEKFHWFFTSQNKLAIGGRDAQQNDILYSKYFEDDDLFFHADIKGASAVILKKGTTADKKELEETAQFTGCYSKAWASGFATIDVYALRKEQVSKHATGGYVAKGGFVLKGERKWFRNVELKLTLFSKKTDGVDVLNVFPGDLDVTPRIIITPGKKKKGEVAKKVSKILNVDADDVIMALPGPSEFKIIK